MGLPLDDSYIYLTYAKQFGRAQPFTYFPGGGYSAGSTSVLWPMLLAPFWTLGARGHALVWVSFGMCSGALRAPSASACIGSCARIAGSDVAGVLAAAMRARRSRRSRGARCRGWRSRSRARCSSRRCCCCCDQPRDRPADASCSSRASRRRRCRGPRRCCSSVGDRRRRDRAAAAPARLARGRVVARAARRAGRCGCVANQLFAGQLLPEHRRREEPLLPAGLRLDVLVRRRSRTLTGKMLRRACSGTATSPLVWPQLVALAAGSSARCAIGALGAAREALARRRARDRRAVRDDARGDRVVGAVELPELSLHRAGVPAARDPGRLRARAAARSPRSASRASLARSRRDRDRRRAVRARRAPAAASPT